MKALRYEKYGGTEVIHLVDIEKPSPKDNEVLVKVHAASMNDWDTSMSAGVPYFMRFFTGLFRPKTRYQFPGCDVAGEVESLGNKVSQLKVGDRVYGDLCKAGFSSFSEYVCVAETVLGLMPDEMGYEQAACLPQAGQLAVQGLLDTKRLKPGKKLLINGAGGGVGTLGIQIAKRLGCEVTAVDSAEKLDLLVSLGADYAIDYQQQDFSKMDTQYDLILDTRTTRSPFSHNRALAQGGLYATVGGSMFWVLVALVLSPLSSMLVQREHRIVAQAPNRDLSLLSEMYQTGQIDPVIDSKFTLENYRAAYERYLSARHEGNVIILMHQAPA